MKKTYLIFILLFLLSHQIYSQKQFNNWFFGRHAGITFNTPDGSPKEIINDSMEFEGAGAAISDNNRKLLFYTNGAQIRDSNQILIESGLFGGSLNQSALIIPVPDDSTLYYIFTNDVFKTVDSLQPSHSHGISYSILSFPNKNLIKKNILLINNDSATGKMIAIRHRNKKDFWFITQEWNSNIFRAYLLTKDGLSAIPILSNSGNIHSKIIDTWGWNNYEGYITSTIDGKEIATVCSKEKYVEIFDFDNQSGKITLNKTINLKNFAEDSLTCHNLYGISFSPNNKLLYISCTVGPELLINSWDYNTFGEIFQFNLETDIPSMYIVAKDSNNRDFDVFWPFFALQLGPDFKIYIAVPGVYPDLSENDNPVINNPNVFGPGCNFSRKGYVLHYGYHIFGLPSIIPGIYNINQIIMHTRSNNPVCYNDTLKLYSDFEYPIFAYNLQWTGPNGFVSKEQNPSIPNMDSSKAGYYYVTVDDYAGFIIDSVYINVYTNPKVYIMPNNPTIQCPDDSVILKADVNRADVKYQWWTGDTTASIKINKPGWYGLTVFDSNGCKANASAEVKPGIKPFVKIDGFPFLCPGGSTTINAVGDFLSIHWSTGDTDRSIKITTVGKYYVDVMSNTGCHTIDSIDINSYQFNLLPIFDTINLGDIGYKKFKDTILEIKNSGNIKESAFLRLPFNFITIISNFNIDSGSIIKISLHFIGESYKNSIFDSIIVIDSICGYMKIIYLLANIIYPPASCTLQSLSFKGCPGDIIEIPIILKNNNFLKQSGATSILLDLSFNSSLLSPLYEPKGTVTNCIRTIPLNLPLSGIQNDTLIKIKFIVGLGNDTITPLIISNFTAVGGKVMIDTINGVFHLECVCHEGGARLINIDGTLSLTCKPNPANDKVQFDFTTIEDGHTELFISDMLGNKLMKVFESDTHGK